MNDFKRKKRTNKYKKRTKETFLLYFVKIQAKTYQFCGMVQF